MVGKDIPYRNKAHDSLSVSLVKLTGGKRIADIEGYVGDPYSAGATFVLHRVTFDDGTFMFFEGEHDCPYLVDYVKPEMGGAKFVVDLEDLRDEDDD